MPNFITIFTLFFGLFFYTLSSSLTFALDPKKDISQYIIDQWTTKDGLSSNTLNELYQTRDGFIWISTYKGLMRFDGINFKNFNTKNLPYLTTSATLPLYQTPDDSLWVGTLGGGIFVQKDHNFNFYTPVTTKNNSLEHTIQSITKAPDGSLWIGTRGHGILIYKNGVFTSFKEISKLNSTSVNAITYSKNEKTTWIATEGNGLFSYQNKITQEYNVANGMLINDVISTLLVDNTNTLWIGTKNGVNRIQNGKSEIIKELEGIRINHILEDAAGSIWFATSAGLFRKNPLTNQYEVLNTENGLPHNDVIHISSDKEGNLWLAMYRAGLIRLKDGKFINYTAEQGLSSISISSIQEVDKNTYWVGSDAGIINVIKDQKIRKYPLKTNLSTQRLRTIFKDKEGNIWIASYAGLLRIAVDGTEKLFTTDNGLTNNHARVITQTSNGNIWLGTRGGGLNEYSATEKKWISFTQKDGFTSDFIMSIDTAPNGNLVVGTDGAGVSIIDLKTRKVSKNYTQADGLPSNIIFSARYDSKNILWICANSGLVAISPNDVNKINTFTLSTGFPVDEVFDVHEDSQNNLWFSSSQGVIRVERNSITDYFEGKRKDVKTEVFDRSDGMKNEECVGAVLFHKDSQDRMWFPTLEGISMIDHKKIVKNSIPPPVYILNMSADSINYSFPTQIKEKIILEAGVKRVTFHFTGLSLVSPSDMHFKYRLKGFDEDWIEVVNDRDVLYTGLAPKQYTFEVMAANNDGVWSEKVETISFRVKPYFYQRAYFWVLVVLLFLGLVWLAYKYKTKRIKNQNLKLEKIIAERTTALREKNEEVSQQNEEILQQNQKLENQQKLVETAYENISLLSEVGKQITSHLSVEMIIEMVYESVNKLLDASIFAIGIYNEKNNSLDFINAKENGSTLFLHQISLKESNLPAYCFTNNKEINIKDLQKEFNDYIPNQKISAIEGEVPESLIYVPINYKNQTIGVLTVQSFEKNSYTQNHLNLVQNIAVYAAIALINAESYQQITTQSKAISLQNENIQSSINYASRIQRAMLPPIAEIKNAFESAFVFWLPRDVVSGDFYWFAKVENKICIAAVDCTGHGVPGAFMSMIGNDLLNHIVLEKKITTPSLILANLHEQVSTALRQSESQNRDGMDISLCVFDTITNELSFAGAKSPLYYLQNGELKDIAGSKFPIGGKWGDERARGYKNYTLKIEQETTIFLCTDGYQDQFGGKKGKKLMKKKMKELFVEIADLKDTTQKEKLENYFFDWKKDEQQVDDVLVMGFKVGNSNNN